LLGNQFCVSDTSLVQQNYKQKLTSEMTKTTRESAQTTVTSP